jgi:hypothetical protein
MFLISFFKGVGKVFKAIGVAFVKVFTSPQAQEVFRLIIEKILPEAKPIVESIRAIIKDPANATVPEIIALYSSFGKTISTIVDTKEAKQNALLNLATELLDAVLPEKYAVPLLHSAIEIALSALKAEGK